MITTASLYDGRFRTGLVLKSNSGWRAPEVAVEDDSGPALAVTPERMHNKHSDIRIKVSVMSW